MIVCAVALEPTHRPPLWSSKPLSSTPALRIRKIAVEREADFLNERIDAEMKALGRLATFSNMIESAIELRQIADLDH